MILVFAKKYNQLIIYVLFPKFFVTRETKKRKKSDPSGTRTRSFRFQFQARYLLSTQLHVLDYFIFLLSYLIRLRRAIGSFD